MRTPAALAVLALAVAACHDAPTEAFSPASGPAPSGLPVTLQIAPQIERAPAKPPTIWAQGDSLIVTAEYEYNVCRRYAAAAGTVDGSLVVTIAESLPYNQLGCAPPEEGAAFEQTAAFLAVVRPAPRGTYTVVLRQRLDYRADGPVERERARASITLP